MSREIRPDLTDEEREIILDGCLINYNRERRHMD